MPPKQPEQPGFFNALAGGFVGLVSGLILSPFGGAYKAVKLVVTDTKDRLQKIGVPTPLAYIGGALTGIVGGPLMGFAGFIMGVLFSPFTAYEWGDIGMKKGVTQLIKTGFRDFRDYAGKIQPEPLNSADSPSVSPDETTTLVSRTPRVISVRPPTARSPQANQARTANSADAVTSSQQQIKKVQEIFHDEFNGNVGKDYKEQNINSSLEFQKTPYFQSLTPEEKQSISSNYPKTIITLTFETRKEAEDFVKRMRREGIPCRMLQPPVSTNATPPPRDTPFPGGRP